MGKRACGVLRMLSFVVVLLSSFCPGCLTSPPEFDESSWRRQVGSARTEDLDASHFRDGEFYNPWMPQSQKGFGRLLRWKLSVGREYTAEEERYMPALIPGTAERLKAMPEGDYLVWIGHATFLMRLNGEYWITDPMLSDRALLPKRKVPPALTAGDLKGLSDARLNVIISHDHYDHLDVKTIEALPDNARFFVPLGVGKIIIAAGKKYVIEMDWWQTVDAGGGTTVAFLPAQHWSRRLGEPANSTLWGSFIIATSGTTVYYGGDSGYFIGYREIGRRYPAIDYALIPVTAYHPRWFMHYSHMDVDESIDAFHDLKAAFFVPTQWGTFRLGDEPPGFPALDLKRAISRRQLDGSRFVIMDIGQVMRLPGKNRCR